MDRKAHETDFYKHDRAVNMAKAHLWDLFMAGASEQQLAELCVKDPVYAALNVEYAQDIAATQVRQSEFEQMQMSLDVDDPVLPAGGLRVCDVKAYVLKLDRLLRHHRARADEAEHTLVEFIYMNDCKRCKDKICMLKNHRNKFLLCINYNAYDYLPFPQIQLGNLCMFQNQS